MGYFIRKFIEKITIIAIMIISLSCGDGKERVDTIKGPKGETGSKGEAGSKGEPGSKGEAGTRGDRGDKGDKGDRGDRGETGSVVVQTPAPQPPIPVPPIPQPPVIIYPPYPSDPGNYCSGCIIVCACIQNRWQSIIINVHDRYLYNIKNDGVCF
jgi:hypothetical protein